MMILNYPTKKELKANVGEQLQYTETSLFGQEYNDNGWNTGCNRPHLTGYKREFFARVLVKGGKIAKVE
jgi:hypothetical protein